MRATAEFDTYRNELRNFVYPEEPTRIAKQLKRLFVCLKSLDEGYSDEKALRIVGHVAKSSAFPVRVKVFEYLLQKFKKGEEKDFSTSKISEALGIGKSTAKRECLVLEALKLIDCRREPTPIPEKFLEFWKYNPSMKIIDSILGIIYINTILVDGQEKKQILKKMRIFI